MTLPPQLEFERLAENLTKEVLKLSRYVTQYSTREQNITEALGKTGTKLLNKIIVLAEEIENDFG